YVRLNTRRFDDQCFTVPATDRISHLAGLDVGRKFATIHIDSPPCCPFSIPQIDAIPPVLPEFELMRREHLSRQSPWLTSQIARILQRIERKMLQRLSREQTSHVIALYSFGLSNQLHGRTGIVRRIIEQLVKPIEPDVRARKETKGTDCSGRRVTPHTFQFRPRRLGVSCCGE